MAYCNYLYIFVQNKLKMKRIFILTIVAAINFNHAIAQTDSTSVKSDSTTTVKAETSILSPSDSVFFEFFDYVATDFAQRMHPEYKLYQTENIYTFLQLDTKTGMIEQVQWSLDSDKEGSVTINSDDLTYGYGYGSGSFELYPTKNMYQFILIDKTSGKKWHVQWGMESSKRWIRRIY